ncbi:MAG: hypothetical protein HKN68_03765 [Saprospiraceae bacterium]|nr:hypothetical protein [Saprospiraceae bacterium]
MKRLWTYILSGFLTLSALSLSAQDMPSVYLIGEHEAEYETMISNHKELLLGVCNNSMDLAYEKWSGMLSQMEQYADSIDYDIKGVKVWINIFWAQDGTIRHIVYYPKPNSKNIDFDRFTIFLKDFIGLYQMEVEAPSGFSHYGSASFPTHVGMLVKDK